MKNDTEVNENNLDLSDKRIAVMLFAFITMMIAFASLFFNVGIACLLLLIFFIGNALLIGLAYDIFGL